VPADECPWIESSPRALRWYDKSYSQGVAKRCKRKSHGTPDVEIIVDAELSSSGPSPYDNGATSWEPRSSVSPTHYLADMRSMVPHGYLSFSLSAAHINGQSWDPETPYDVLEFDKFYEVEMSDSGAHPLFHLHVYHMQVVTPGGCQDHEEGQFYDTISARGTCTVRISTRDIGVGGRTVYNCHVLAHEDHGAMGWVHVQNAPPVSTTIWMKSLDAPLVAFHQHAHRRTLQLSVDRDWLVPITTVVAARSVMLVVPAFKSRVVPRAEIGVAKSLVAMG
jgi:hypothetical protein